MSDAPERIWAFAPDIFDNLSVWQDAPSPAGDTIEYVRADRIEELEAKLAKAVDVIEWVLIAWDDHHKHGYNMQGDWEPDARTTLAELKGEK